MDAVPGLDTGGLLDYNLDPGLRDYWIPGLWTALDCLGCTDYRLWAYQTADLDYRPRSHGFLGYEAGPGPETEGYGATGLGLGLGYRLPDLGPGLPGYQADHHLQDLQTWAWAWTAGLLGY
jgi:hypothetical protein